MDKGQCWVDGGGSDVTLLILLVISFAVFVDNLEAVRKPSCKPPHA